MQWVCSVHSDDEIVKIQSEANACSQGNFPVKALKAKFPVFQGWVGFTKPHVSGIYEEGCFEKLINMEAVFNISCEFDVANQVVPPARESRNEPGPIERACHARRSFAPPAKKLRTKGITSLFP